MESIRIKFWLTYEDVERHLSSHQRLSISCENSGYQFPKKAKTLKIMHVMVLTQCHIHNIVKSHTTTSLLKPFLQNI